MRQISQQFEPGKRQFTLRQMLLASALVACACAVAGWAWRVFHAEQPANPKFMVALLSFMVIGGFLGAAVGALTRRIVRGASWGVLVTIAVVVLVFGLLL